MVRPRFRDLRRTPGSWVSSADMLTAARISYRQLDYWCTAGYIRPDITSPGQGRERSFTAAEAVVVCDMADLVAAGLTPRVASRVAREIAEVGEAELGGFILAVEARSA